MSEHRPPKLRNIVVFILGVLLLGNLFGFYSSAFEGLGELVFILSPVIMALVLRTFGGDGWVDAGFGLHLRGNLGIYAFSVLLFPFAMGAALGLGILTGNVAIPPGVGAALLGAIAFGLPAVFAFAFFEEVGWRGYLEPRLAAFGIPARRRHFYVALVWAPWHLGYILSHPERYDHIALPLLLILTLLAIGAMSVIYGVVRQVTQSIWPAVLLHAIGNAISWPMIDRSLVTIESPLVFAARPDSLLVLLVLIITAGLTLRWRPRGLRT